MQDKTALFFFTQGLGDYVTYGFPMLTRLKEDYTKVIIVALNDSKELIEHLGYYDSALFLEIEEINNRKILSKIIAQFSKLPTIYNSSKLTSLCNFLSELPPETEFHGFYKKEKKLLGTSDSLTKELLPYQEQKYDYTKDDINSTRRNRYLKAFALKTFAHQELKFPGLQWQPSKLIILEGTTKNSPSKNYPYLNQLKELFLSEGYQIFIPSQEKVSLPELFKKISQAQAILSVDSFISRLGLHIGLPTLTLHSATDPDEIGSTNFIQVKQACSPCYNTHCQQMGRTQNCLEDLKPEFVFKRFKSFLRTQSCQITKTTSYPVLSYKDKVIHIFCYHGLGDAIRFALPLARSLNTAGAEVFLHFRHVLSSAIGLQPEGISLVAIEDDYHQQFPNPESAMNSILETLPTADLAVGLGASIMDQVAGICLQKKEVPYWGIRCKSSGLYRHSFNLWAKTLEVNKSRQLLFSLFGAPELPKNEILLNPIATKNISLSKQSVGLHTKAMWPARTYGQGQHLKEILAKKYDVWNFDAPPCDTIGNLAHYILQSKAVLSVDTMVIHLCRALNVPALLIQGPVWHHPDNTPHVIDFTITEPHPKANPLIDIDSQALSQIPAQKIAEAFIKFVESLK